MYLRPVTGDIVPHLNCSGGDYISHHNMYMCVCAFMCIYLYIYIYIYISL